MIKIQNKLLLAFILISLIPLIILGGYGTFSISKSLRTNSISKIQDKAAVISLEIEDFLKNVSSDLFYLRDSVNLQSLISEKTENNEEKSDILEKIKQDFLAFSKHKNIYNQIRFLNPDGKEVVRVDRNNGKSRIIPDEKLQNKKSRYYFADTAKLTYGKLMISPLDLNREHGKVEKPLRPVIRYGTPIYDQQKNFRGIVLMNVQAENFLNLLKQKGTNTEQMMFIDNKGFYYYHSDPNKTWGSPRDLDTGHSFSKDYPEAYAQIANSEIPVSVTQKNYLFATAPVFVGIGSNTKKLGTITDVIQTSEVFKSVTKFRNIFLLIGVVVFFVTLLLAIGMARSITQPLIYLTEATTRMSKGKLKSTISVDTNDETKMLADSIERLRKSMLILMKRIQK